MEYTQSVGNVNELKCIIAFINLGYECSIPYGNASKYDFIVDDGNKLYKIQCKSSHYTNNHGVLDTNSFTFVTISQTTNTNGTIRHKYTSDDIDFFATCFNDQVYLVPVNECSYVKTLRFQPPFNGCKKYNKAEDYKLENFFKEKTDFTLSKNSFQNKNNKHKIYYCEQCGKEKCYGSNICQECASKNSRKVERPTRDVLKELIRNKSFLQISNIFNVSDNCIRKWCKYYKLPYKKSEIKSILDHEWINI